MKNNFKFKVPKNKNFAQKPPFVYIPFSATRVSLADAKGSKLVKAE